MGNKMNTVREKQVGSPQSGRISLAERIARWSIGVNGLDTPIAGLTFHRWKMPTEPTSYTLSPSICLIGQGQKTPVPGRGNLRLRRTPVSRISVDLAVVMHIVEYQKCMRLNEPRRVG